MIKKNRKVGLPPGTLIYTGTKSNTQSVELTYLSYDQENLVKEKYVNTASLPIHRSDINLVQWYDVRGLHDINLIQSLAKNFKIHSLAIEDIVDVHGRPRYEEFSTGHFFSLKTFTFNQQSNSLVSQNISLYYGEGFVMTFQEHEDDFFAILHDRISNKQGRIRQRHTDYLVFAILDLISDRYFTTIDALEESLEQLEYKIVNDIDSINKRELLTSKVHLIQLRKSVAPFREALNQFIRSDSSLIEEQTQVYLRDVYNHVIHVTESIDTLRDIHSGLQDLYLSEISLKMNTIMQFLTIVTAVFVPLSFLTGLYGMNFEYIPELGLKNGYFYLWGVMVLLVIALIYWFKKKRWI